MLILMDGRNPANRVHYADGCLPCVLVVATKSILPPSTE
jgi:hypothetical protein